MRVVWGLFFATLSSAVYGQIVLPADPINQAFQSLRGDLTPMQQPPNQIMLQLTGTDSLGPRVDNLYSNAFFTWDPANLNSTAKAEINDYVNNNHTRRIVADGTTLWSYDFGTNSYTTYVYGSFSGALPKDLRINMLRELSAASRGPATFLARLLRETFSGFNSDFKDVVTLQDSAQYTNWFPGATMNVVTGGGSMTDPVVKSRVYQSTPGGGDVWVVYTYPNRPMRSAGFHLTPYTRADGTASLIPSEIDYADLQYLNASTPRLVSWAMTVYTSGLPATTNFQFVAPSRARAIANVHSNGG